MCPMRDYILGDIYYDKINSFAYNDADCFIRLQTSNYYKC